MTVSNRELPMMPILILAVAVCAVAAIAADWRETHPPLFKLLKPLTTALVIALAWQAPDSAYRTLVLVGLALSLVGDVALTSDTDRAFITGLVSFLVAHILFIVAFGTDVVFSGFPLAGVAILVYGLVFFAILLPRAPAPLRGAIIVYGLVLCGMALAALWREQQLGDAASAYALAGALLFIVSDSSLAARRFIGAYPAAQAVILSTYWAAITLIALSVPGLA